MNLQIERLRQLPQSASDVWQGGLIELPFWADDETGKPVHPEIPGWISTETGYVHMLPLEAPGKLGPDAALTALVQFACHEKLGGYRPLRVQVTDPDVADFLRGPLGEVGIDVEVREELPELEQMLEEMLEHLSSQPITTEPLEVEGVTVEVMRGFAEAAAEFYRAAPWRFLTGDDYLAIETIPADIGPAGAVILGAGGDTFGLGFFDSYEDFEATMAHGDPEEMLDRRPWSLSFENVEEVPMVDAHLWHEHHLPLAGPDAFPLLFRMEPDREPTRPGVPMIAFCQGLLEALARTTEEEIDTGRWSKRIETINGPVEYTFSLADTVEPSAAEGPGAAFNPLMMEKFNKVAQKALKEHDFATPEEATEFLNANMDELIEEAEPITPQEQATELIYQAYETRGRKQLQLVRKALELWPDCPDAHVVLGERESDPAKALEHFTRGMEAGERTLGPEIFEEDAGHFWGLVETRPYMRARFGVARSLEDLGRLDEAIDHFRAMLALNPNDNQGVREELMVCLLKTKRHEELDKLLKTCKNDKGKAMWNYTRALLTFRQKGDTQTARRHLRQAFEDNELVPDYLLEELPLPAVFPDSYALGSEEEAILCADALMEVWQDTPGAVEWLDRAFDRFV